MSTTSTVTNRAERLHALQAQLVDQVARLTTSDDWEAMLATAARFHNYSPNNVLLILMQRPDATKVAGYRTWLSLGRHVRKGEKGIAILAPCRYSVEQANGDKVSVLRGFKVEHVFDISQTDGDDLCDVRPVLLDGDVPAIWSALVAQCEAAGYTVERGDCHGGANGVTNPLTRTVRVRSDVSLAQATKTLLHELAHIKCGHVDSMLDYALHRGICEVEAESVAYVVAAATGFDTGSYSLPYVAGWAGGDVDKVRKTADKVVRVAHTILSTLEGVESVVTEAVAA